MKRQETGNLRKHLLVNITLKKTLTNIWKKFTTIWTGKLNSTYKFSSQFWIESILMNKTGPIPLNPTWRKVNSSSATSWNLTCLAHSHIMVTWLKNRFSTFTKQLLNLAWRFWQRPSCLKTAWKSKAFQSRINSST